LERNLTVRDAVQQDAPAIAELFTQLGYPNTATGVTQRLQEISQDADYRALVAVLDGQVVEVAGLHVIHFFEKEGTWCRLTALVVGEEYRDRGIGRILVEAVERAARDRDCMQVELNSGEHRIDAHAFNVAFVRMAGRSRLRGKGH
jgi:N-acetylglutamate synthase-like GNAT family acetyltransferase